ncbi:FeoB-associated Cys-rich membrane protein [Pseudodesulfovibrio cashew]|uniref:FeoB-associated Cys-rich membrane protein n=1 Tax=Pseudodesulfovibrio cashew TaxID=2678688 RepID=A0A6I6JTA3_9BACT|nr:FeoB-associated Cys-rich membrane protein [Pseudodesulfovibrio cashew]QGY40874.1 FeoB-associated Cys-rich membrane protein [Pseudodesulfovibrio cashew]
MYDTILVGAIILAAVFFVARRLYRQFTAKSGCGCSGCGKDSSCSSAHDNNCCTGCGELR